MNEDAVLLAIGGLRVAMEQTDKRIDRMEGSLGREIRDLKNSLEKGDENCRGCRKEIEKKIESEIDAQAIIFNSRIDGQDEKIKPLVSQHDGEKAVGSWIDNGLGRVGNILGIVSIVIVVTSAIMTFITWVWPLLQKLRGG